MKLNKTLMIAALAAGGMFTAEVAVRAQNATNTPPAGARPAGGPRSGGMNIDYIASQLALTDDQKTKVKPVFEEMRQKLVDLHRDGTLGQADRRAKTKEIRDDATAKLKEILTPDQFEKWQKISAGRRSQGGAGTPPPAAGANPPQ